MCGKGAIFFHAKMYFDIMEWQIQHKKNRCECKCSKRSDNTMCVIVNHDDQHMVNCLIFAFTNPNAMDYIFFLNFLFFQYIYKCQ